MAAKSKTEVGVKTLASEELDLDAAIQLLTELRDSKRKSVQRVMQVVRDPGNPEHVLSFHLMEHVMTP